MVTYIRLKQHLVPSEAFCSSSVCLTLEIKHVKSLSCFLSRFLFGLLTLYNEKARLCFSWQSSGRLLTGFLYVEHKQTVADRSRQKQTLLYDVCFYNLLCSSVLAYDDDEHSAHSGDHASIVIITLSAGGVSHPLSPCNPCTLNYRSVLIN